MPKRYSIHIGVNVLDSQSNFYKDYRNDENQRGLENLNSCIHDAEKMRDVVAVNFDEKHFLPDATRKVVQEAFKKIAGEIDDTDICLITYSGHGIRLPEGQISDEIDSKDESWCLNDAPLLDDEITELILNFKKGRILVISDSCHSGTMIDYLSAGFLSETVAFLKKERKVDFINFEKAVLKAKGFKFADFDETKLKLDLKTLKQPEIESLRRKNIETLRHQMFINNLDNDFSKITENDSIDIPKIKEIQRKLFNFGENKDYLVGFEKFNNAFGKAFPKNNLHKKFIEDFVINTDELINIPLLKNVKTIPKHIAKLIYRDNFRFFDAARKTARENINNSSATRPKIISLSACDDNETTPDGCTATENSKFTEVLLENWANGTFSNSYKEFHKLISDKLTSYEMFDCENIYKTRQQHPQIRKSDNAALFLSEKPMFRLE